MTVNRFIGCLSESLVPSLVESGIPQADIKKITAAIARNTWSKCSDVETATDGPIRNRAESMQALLLATGHSPASAGVPADAIKKPKGTTNGHSAAPRPPTAEEILAEERKLLDEHLPLIKTAQMAVAESFAEAGIGLTNYASLELRKIKDTPYLFCCTTKFNVPDIKRVHKGEMVVNDERMNSEAGGLKIGVLNAHEKTFNSEWVETEHGTVYVRTLYVKEGTRFKLYCARDGASNANVAMKYYVLRNRELVEISQADYAALRPRTPESTF